MTGDEKWAAYRQWLVEVMARSLDHAAKSNVQGLFEAAAVFKLRAEFTSQMLRDMDRFDEPKIQYTSQEAE